MGLLNAMRRLWERLFGHRTASNRQAPAPPHALDAVCAQFMCRYERSIFPTGEVQIRLIRVDATLSAVGATTAEAVERVVQKATSCWGTL